MKARVAEAEVRIGGRGSMGGGGRGEDWRQGWRFTCSGHVKLCYCSYHKLGHSGQLVGGIEFI